MRIFLSLLISCLSLQTYASNTFHCTPLTLQPENNTIVLPGVDQPRTTKLYFFKNISPKSLWIDHPVAKPSASAGWSTYLQPGRWSVLLLNRKNFAINCSVILPGVVETKNCAKTLAICTPKNAAYESKRKGSYWLTEDSSWDETFNVLKKRGVVFK